MSRRKHVERRPYFASGDSSNGSIAQVIKKNARVERRSYAVTGASKDDLLESIHKNGPARKGEHYVAYTDWTIDWDFDFRSSGKTFHVVNPRVRVTVSVMLPEWRPSSNAPAELKADWKRARAAIQEHESQHAALALLAGHRVLEKLRALGPVKSMDRKPIDAVACAAIEQVKAAERKHDEKTEHGLTQGTYL